MGSLMQQREYNWVKAMFPLLARADCWRGSCGCSCGVKNLKSPWMRTSILGW